MTESEIRSIVREEIKGSILSTINERVDGAIRELVELRFDRQLKEKLLEVLNVARREGGMLMAEKLMEQAMTDRNGH